MRSLVARRACIEPETVAPTVRTDRDSLADPRPACSLGAKSQSRRARPSANSETGSGAQTGNVNSRREAST